MLQQVGMLADGPGAISDSRVRQHADLLQHVFEGPLSKVPAGPLKAGSSRVSSASRSLERPSPSLRPARRGRRQRRAEPAPDCRCRAPSPAHG